MKKAVCDKSIRDRRGVSKIIVAQRKRVGLITRRTVDRNNPMIFFFLQFTHRIVKKTNDSMPHSFLDINNVRIICPDYISVNEHKPLVKPVKIYTFAQSKRRLTSVNLQGVTISALISVLPSIIARAIR